MKVKQMLVPRRARPMRGSRMMLGAAVTAMMLATAGVTAGAASAAKGVSHGAGNGSVHNHCFSPEGVDANRLLRVSEQFFQPDACNVLKAGESYVPLGGPGFWVMNTFWEAVPADYTPSGRTPLHDFITKVRAMTYVVDPGTRHERAYRSSARDIMETRTLRAFFPESGPDWPVALFLAKLPPLRPGDHQLGAVIDMRARHCDGLGADSSNCLRAGSTQLAVCPFKVVPRNRRADRR